MTWTTPASSTHTINEGTMVNSGLECEACGGVAILPEPDGTYAQGQRACAECEEIGFVCESHDGTPFWWSQGDLSGRS